MVSGKALSLFPDAFKTFILSSELIESGNDNKRFEEMFSSSNMPSTAMESGIACHP